jgi:acetolactate synthase-1/2/3 large subunit
MNVAELLVACLEREGITHVFALPGEENAHAMFALEASDIEVIMTRHEQGAGFMAEAYVSHPG